MRVQRATPAKIASLVKGLDKKQLRYRPTPGKWSITEILAHLADTELVCGWRMRLILGQNGAPVHAFDQDTWATSFNYQRRDPRASLATFALLRQNNLALLKSIPKEKWDNYGMHQERGKESMTQIVRMFAGHDLNHLRQIEELAKAAKKRPGRSRR